jgi:hypothetical protein
VYDLKFDVVTADSADLSDYFLNLVGTQGIVYLIFNLNGSNKIDIYYFNNVSVSGSDYLFTGALYTNGGDTTLTVNDVCAVTIIVNGTSGTSGSSGITGSSGTSGAAGAAGGTFTLGLVYTTANNFNFI